MKTKRVEFGGETFEVPSDWNGRSIAEAQRAQRSLRASEKPAETPSKPKATQTPKKSTSPSKAPSSAPTGSPRPKARPQSGKDPIGASRPPTQPRTRGLPDSPSMTRTAGSQADRMPSRTPPRALDVPGDRDSAPASRQTRYRNPVVRKEDVTSFDQWMGLTREQRRNAGLPVSQAGARLYFARK
jgi:hypothetical protein